MSSYSAHKQYSIPRSTIENHIRGKTVEFRAGRPPLFSDEQEELIFDFIVTLSKWGYPPNIEEFVKIAQKFASQYQINCLLYLFGMVLLQMLA